MREVEADLPYVRRLSLDRSERQEESANNRDLVQAVESVGKEKDIRWKRDPRN